MFIPKTKQELLTRWLQRLRLLETCHFEAATPLSSQHLALGIPVVILSTIVGTTVFATLEKSLDPAVKIAVALISVTAAILSSLQTFLRFSERSETHKTSAYRIGPIRREIEQLLTSVNTENIPEDTISKLRGQIDEVSTSELTIPDSIYKKVSARLKLEEHMEANAS